MWRVAVALIVVLMLTAFAPAPFLEGDGDHVSLRSIQGRWRAKREVVGAGGALEDGRDSVRYVRVRDGLWTFLPVDYSGATVLVSIERKKGQSRLTFYHPGEPGKVYGVGLIRRQGKAVRVLYAWGGEDRRPATWADMPKGYYVVTLEPE